MNRTTPDAAASGRSEGAGRSLLRGVAAFAGVAALGLAVGLAEFAASGGAYHWWTWIKVGALYLVSFFGVSERVDLGARTLFEMHLPLMAGTGLAGWLLFRAGRRVSARSAVRVWLRAGCVALGFSVPVSALGLLARLRFPDLGGPGVDATVRAIAWQVMSFPLIFAVVVVTVGVWWVRPMRSVIGAGVRRVIAGGWRMCWLALVFASAGLLVVAAIRSDRTAQYAGWLGSQGRGGALLFGHQVLAAPNQSFFVLAPAMGGITDVWGSVGGMPTTSVSISKIGAAEFVVPGLKRPVPERELGGLFYLFFLVPAIATVLGGRYVAEGATSFGRRMRRGAASGVVFGALVAAGSMFASVEAPLSRGEGPLRIQPSMPSTALLALAWGIGGGAIGALFARQPVDGVGPEVGADPPLSPTSA